MLRNPHSCLERRVALMKALIARNFLFHPLGSLPAEGPGSEGVRGEVGGIQGHRRLESSDSAR